MQLYSVLALALLAVQAELGIIPSLSNTNSIDAGFVFQSERAVNIYTNSLTGSVVVKLLPNLPDHLKSCHLDVLSSYNRTLTSIFQPLGESIKHIWGNTTGGSAAGGIQSRIVGAILGGVALGVATSAQITAGVALAQSRQNAENILKLKQSIAATNDAVQEVIAGQRELVIAIGKMQDYINQALNSTIQQIDCVTAANRLGVELSLYLTQLTTAFSNQIQNPALTPLSIQALYNLAGDNLDRFLNRIGATTSNLQSIISSGLIQGQPIGYDSEKQLLILSVSVPSINAVDNLRMAQLTPIVVSTSQGLGAVVIPKYIIAIADLIEEFVADDCIFTTSDAYCTSLTTLPLSNSLQQCIRGNVSACSYSLVRGVLSTKFITLDGSVIANCQAVTCRCIDPPKIISQFAGKPLTIINSKICNVINIEQVTLRLSGHFMSQYGANLSISEGQIVVTGPLDISNELGRVNQSITNAQASIDKSNQILEGVNVRLIQVPALATSLALAIAGTVLGALAIIGVLVLWVTNKKQSKKMEWLLASKASKM
uniref:Fusion glycoprotein F0 n=1 Tax=Avulavirus sp. TaxID=2493083 RepID=A0A481XX20_9MONO|nr:F [Avulavirus sp.] [Avulavirus sp.]